jgi:hypothetical protein
MAQRTQRGTTTKAKASAPTPAESPDAFAQRARAEMAQGGSTTVSDTEQAEGAMPDASQPEMGTEQDTQGEMPSTTQVEMTGDTEDTKAIAEALKEARADAIKWRSRLREMEAQQQAAQDAELSESERQAKRLADMERALEQQQQHTRSLALESAVAMRANALGIVDAEVAVALLDRDALDYDDSGRPDADSLDMALKRLIKAKPYLKTAQAPSSPANPARSEPVGETDQQRRARLYGGGGGIFDPVVAASLGGGVVSND